MRVLAFVPSFFGSQGDAVNERQLITAMALKVEKCYVVTIVGVLSLFKQVSKEERELIANLPRNMTIIPLPLPKANTLLAYLTMSVTSFVMGPIALMMSVLRKADLVYVRDSFLAIGILIFPSLAKKTIVKIPAIIEDELENGGFAEFCMAHAAHFVDRFVLTKAKRIAIGRPLYNKLVMRRFYKYENSARAQPLEITAGVDLQTLEKVKGRIHKKSPRSSLDIGFIGSLTWWQGIDILVQAIVLLNKKMPNLRLVVIGDGRLRPWIEEACKSSDISYEVTGFLPHEEALERLAMLDILVLPRKRMTSTESIIPMKVMEAWGLGIPVIVTEHQAFLDNQVRNYEEVLYCKPEPNSVANAMYTLLNNDELRKKLETNGSRLAKRFDYDEMAGNLLKA